MESSRGSNILKPQRNMPLLSGPTQSKLEISLFWILMMKFDYLALFEFNIFTIAHDGLKRQSAQIINPQTWYQQVFLIIHIRPRCLETYRQVPNLHHIGGLEIIFTESILSSISTVFPAFQNISLAGTPNLTV